MRFEGKKESKYLIDHQVNAGVSTPFIDELFVLGIILAPMTALRIYKFGPGEMLLIVWMILVLLGKNSCNIYTPGSLPITLIGRYQIANIIMMMVGMVMNFILYQGQTAVGTILTTFFTHAFMFIFSSCVFLYFDERELQGINLIIRKIVLRGAIIYGLLLLYALYINTHLLGIELWLGNRGYRFLGLALNPHQIAMITGVGIFFSLYLSSVEERLALKLFYYMFAFLWFIISLSLRSDTLTLTYIILLPLMIFLKILKSTKSEDIRSRNLFFMIGVVVLFTIALLPWIWNHLHNFVVTAGNGLGRLDLWVSGMSQFKEKPICFITGLGPGGNTGQFMTVTGNEIEAHNTYIQQILNSGVLIFLYYFYVIVELLKKPLEKNTFLFLSIMYFVVYGFGGNMNRRVLVWFTYTIAMILFEKTKDTEISEL